MVERRVVKGCCGRKAVLMISTVALEKCHIPLFKQAGYIIPENYAKAGLFYAKKGTFIATATFGLKNINIRCSGSGCEELISAFEAIIKTIEG